MALQYNNMIITCSILYIIEPIITSDSDAGYVITGVGSFSCLLATLR